MIADEVLPRATVGGKLFQYNEYDRKQAFTIPDTRVGRTSKPNEVEFGASRKEASTEDHGLEDPIPAADEVVVSKSERELVLLREGQPVATYRISLGGEPTGHKTQEGDESSVSCD